MSGGVIVLLLFLYICVLPFVLAYVQTVAEGGRCRGCGGVMICRADCRDHTPW